MIREGVDKSTWPKDSLLCLTKHCLFCCCSILKSRARTRQDKDRHMHVCTRTIQAPVITPFCQVNSGMRAAHSFWTLSVVKKEGKSKHVASKDVTGDAETELHTIEITTTSTVKSSNVFYSVRLTQGLCGQKRALRVLSKVPLLNCSIHSSPNFPLCVQYYIYQGCKLLTLHKLSKSQTS